MVHTICDIIKVYSGEISFISNEQEYLTARQTATEFSIHLPLS